MIARKTRPRKLNRGEGIISIKHGPKNVYDFLGTIYCVIVLLCVFLVAQPYVIYFILLWDDVACLGSDDQNKSF